MIRPIVPLLCAVLLASSCAEPDAKASAPRPALWKVADSDTTLYIFGSIHMLPKDIAWQTPVFTKALNASDLLVLEVVLSKDPTQNAAILQKLATSPNLPPILDRVPADKRPALQSLIDKSGMAQRDFDKMETWAAAITLGALSLRDVDISPDQGIETQLTRAAEKAGKPIAGLETTEQQLGYFDTLSEHAQRNLLVNIIDDTPNAKSDFQKMVTAWLGGDTQKIAANFDDELRSSPELSQALLQNRNAHWATWIKHRLQTPGTVMIAVGTGHLAGPASVQSLLEKQGVKISRVQ